MQSYASIIARFQGWIHNFLRVGASLEDMTDVQSQKSAEELPNMHASAN